MIITGITFMFSVFTAYSFHRHAIEDIHRFQYEHWLHMMWLIYFLIITLTTIYVAVKVTKEVCIFV